MLALNRRFSVLIALVTVLLIASPGLLAYSLGNLSGLVRDQDGDPRGNLLVSLVDLASRYGIPVLTTTDQSGQIYLKNLAAGTYRLLVKSSRYQGPLDRMVEIRPAETAVVSLIVHEILGLGYESGRSVGVKGLLRAADNPRLIFRGLEPGNPEDRSMPIFDEAVVEVYTSAGFGGDRLVFPGDPAHGITTNFAARDKLPNGTEYVIAGQFNSGNDSLFRIKNWLNYDLGENHQLRLLMGYGRVAFTEPSLALLDNPSFIAGEEDYLKASGTTKVLTLGFQDRWKLGPALSFMWGAEMNQVRRRFNDYFVSPNAALVYNATSSTSIQVSVSSKRNTLSNSVSLPDGQRVLLNDSIQFSNIRGHAQVGTARYYEATLSQKLGADTKLEVAAFDSRLLRATPHLLARFERDAGVDFLDLNDAHSRTKGYRLTVDRRITDNLRATFSYIRGSAPSIDPLNNHVLVDPFALGALFRQHGFHALAAELEAYVPRSSTRVTAVFRTVPYGDPITSVDPLSDVYETPNRSVNLFVRQLVPVPMSLIRFLGLDFLAGYRLEALLDIRNLANENLGVVPSSAGNVVLVQQPRSLRGGLAVRF